MADRWPPPPPLALAGRRRYTPLTQASINVVLTGVRQRLTNASLPHYGLEAQAMEIEAAVGLLLRLHGRIETEIAINNAKDT